MFLIPISIIKFVHKHINCSKLFWSRTIYANLNWNRGTLLYFKDNYSVWRDSSLQIKRTPYVEWSLSCTLACIYIVADVSKVHYHVLASNLWFDVYLPSPSWIFLDICLKSVKRWWIALYPLCPDSRDELRLR